MSSSSKTFGEDLDENQNVVKDILGAAVASVFTDHVQDNQEKSDNVPGSDYEKSSPYSQERVSAQVEEAIDVPAQHLDDDKILGAGASQTTPVQVEENPLAENVLGSGSEKSSPQSQNRGPAPAQVEGTPPADEVKNISGSESEKGGVGTGSGIITKPVPLVMSKGGDGGQASTSRPRSRSSPRRSRSRSMASDTGSSSGTGNSKRSRSSSSSSMSSSSASEAPASKRRRPRSSSLSLTTESESDDATARNEGGAPAGNAVNEAAAANVQDFRDAVEVDNVSAEQQVLEGNSTSTESEGMEDDFSALGLGNNEAGQDVYYLVIKCSAATIGNRHHMMAVLEHYGDFNAQEGTDAEGIVTVIVIQGINNSLIIGGWFFQLAFSSLNKMRSVKENLKHWGFGRKNAVKETLNVSERYEVDVIKILAKICFIQYVLPEHGSSYAKTKWER